MQEKYVFLLHIVLLGFIGINSIPPSLLSASEMPGWVWFPAFIFPGTLASAVSSPVFSGMTCLRWVARF